MARDKKNITRNRISYSCQRCRQRKVKCDKIHPICGSCQRTSEECVYTSTENDDLASHEVNTADESPARKRKHASVVSQHEDSESDNKADGAAGSEDQLLRLSILLNQLSDSTGISHSTEHGANSQPEHENGVFRSGAEGDDQSPGLTYVRNSSEPQRGSNIDTISTQLEKLIELLHTKQTDFTGKASTHLHEPDISSALRKDEPADSDGELFIPTEQQRNVLFRCWLSSVYPVLPIVDPALVLLHYRTFHFWYLHGLEKGMPNPSEELVPLIFAIYYAGVKAMSLRGFRKWFPGAQRQSLVERVQRQVLKTLEVPVKLLCKPEILAAKVMMCYMTSQNNDEIGLISRTAPLVRTAYSCNLHRERFNEKLDDDAAELRRRLWWETVIIDTMEAATSNVPPSTNHQHLYSDVAIPSELKDSKLGTLEAAQYKSDIADGRAPDAADDVANNGQSSMVSVIYLVMKARIFVGMKVRQLLSINLATRPRTKEDMIQMRQCLTEVTHYINAVVSRIPTKGMPENDFTPIASKLGQSISVDYGTLYGEDLLSCELEAACGRSFLQPESPTSPFIQLYRNSMVAFHKWARVALSMLNDQTQCLSYAPFLSNSKTNLWISARQCALRHAHSCLRKFNALATDLELEGFRWTWPGFFQPIHAFVIILLDTYERPTSREASRSRALLDEMLLLSSPDYGLVGGVDGLTKDKPLQEGGMEGYTMLMQLRAKAWHKAGLDPSLLWTEKDQIDVGVATPLTDDEKLAQSFREDTILGVGENGQHKHILLHPLVHGRISERMHPSEVGPPEDGGGTAIDCIAYTESLPLPKQNKKRFLRARPDQNTLQDLSTVTKSTLKSRPGYIYRFKPPSQLTDVAELVKKIKNFQQSRQTRQPDDPSISSRQVETVDIDLTDFSGNGQNPATITTARDTTLQDLASIFQHIATSNPAHLQSTINEHLSKQSRSLTPSSTSASKAALSSSASNQPHPRSQPQAPNFPSAQATALAPQAPPETVADMISMVFDWAKWDEIFGHILSDSADGDSLSLDAE